MKRRSQRLNPSAMAYEPVVEMKKQKSAAPHSEDLAVPGCSYTAVAAPKPSKTSQYQQLLAMDKQDLVRNVESSLCHLCDGITSAGLGVVLVNCLHTFCAECLKQSLLKGDTVRCPFPKGRYECVGNVEDRELEALLDPDEYRALMERQFEAISDVPPAEEKPKKATVTSRADLELLVTLSDASVVPNPEAFECPICFVPYEPYEGVILRDCFHCFCRECLGSSIKHADDVVVKCPYKDNDSSCESVIQDREIRTLLSAKDYGAYLERSLKKAESLAGKAAFHCKTPDCAGWCLVEAEVNWFECPVCQASNCLKCKALHDGMTCEDYQDRLTGNYENRRSERAVQNMMDAGQAMLCPSCKMVLTKIQGCDYIVCSVCKTGVCWATRGPRWGPLGVGDTSGGCRCKVNGMKCHPNCNNCH